MKLVEAWLCARRHQESSFHHCGGPVKLVEAWLCASRHLESSFHHCGGSVKLVQACFVCQEGSREQFSPLWWSCPARGGLFKC